MNGKRLIACAMAGLLSLQTALSMPGIYAVAAEPTTEVTDNTVLSSEGASQTEEDMSASDSGNEGVDNSSSSEEYDASSEGGEGQSIEEDQSNTGNEDSIENDTDMPDAENGEGGDPETQVQPDSGNQQDDGNADQEDETVTEYPADGSRSEVVTEIPVEQTVETEVPMDIAPVEITEELPAVGSDDNDALFEEYVDGLFHGGAAKNRGKLKAKRVRQFDGAAGLVYDTIQAGAKQIAVGERASTEFVFTREDLGYASTAWSASDLGVSEIVTDGAISEIAQDAALQKFREDVNISDIIDALLASNPYDFYWYDKTAGTPSGYSVGAEWDGSEYRIYINQYSVSFPVAQEYAESAYKIDTAKVSAPLTAAENARAIINDYAGEDDIAKLTAYKDIICDWVDYNHSAADNENTPYGNPWQLIWVFDGNRDTTVVCEGYSKAFQYLCDESSFSDSQISCRTVTGNMTGGTGEGGHMWNLVTLNDGKTYLADITNCDEGSVGAPDLLFLASCASGNVSEGYRFFCDETSIDYIYDSDTTSLYSEEELTVSGTAYDPASIPEEIAYSGDCGENAVWSLEEGVLTISGSGTMTDFDSLDSVPWRKSLDEINKVVIEDGVTSIGSFAFAGCTALTSVTIPVSIGTIGAYAFDNTNQEKDIYYASSLAVWNQISINGTGNDSLNNAAMHYVVQIHISADANTTVRVRIGSADAVEEESDESLLSDGDYVDSGTVLTVSRTPGTGYELIGQEQEEITVGGDDVEITASSKIPTYTVTLLYENGEVPTYSVSDLTAVERGTAITVTAGAAKEGYEFTGWYETNGKLLTAEDSYTISVYTDVTIEARYQKTSGLVHFVSNDRVIKSVACSSISEQDFPVPPTPMFGFAFAGWDQNVEQINAGLSEGKNVTVKALFSPAPSAEGFAVSIYNGEKETPDIRTFRESSIVSIKAETVSGKNFSHWLLDGELLSYNTTAAFRATKACTLKAVYSTEEVQAQGTAVLRTAIYNNATRKLVINSYLTAPDGAVIRKAGLVAASEQSAKYNPSDELTNDNADYVKSLAAAEGKGGAVSYTWTKTKVNPGDVWYARAYLSYELDGSVETIYGDLREIHAGDDFDTAEKGTAEIKSSEYLADIKKAKFVAYLTVPDLGVIEKSGLVAASAETFDPATDVLTSSNAAYAKSLATAVGKTGAVSYTWTKTKVEPGDIWYARAWLVYKDADGKEHTVYGPLETLDTSGFIKTYEAPTSVSLNNQGIVSMQISETQPHTVMLGLYRQAAAAAGTMSTMSVKGAGLRNAPVADADELVAVVPARINGEAEYSVNVSNLISEPGTYYVTAKAVGSEDEKNARDMTVGTDSAVSSDPVPFTRPDESLAVPANVTWDSETYGRARWSEVPEADSYQVMLYSGDDIVASRNINTTYFNFSSGWIDYNNIASKQYTFTVTAMSGNIAEISNSAQSERSAVLGEIPSRDPVAIVTQPADKYGSLGKTVTASLAASGIGLTYDWYVDGEKITDGADDATVRLDSSKARTISVYCTVHDAFGNNVTSEQAQVTIVDDSPIQGFIQVQPSDVKTDPDLQYKEFRIATASLKSGFRATYKWYVDYGSGYTFNGSTSTETLIKATPSNNGAKVKCHVTVTAPTGRIVFDEDSTEAVLRVNEKPIVIEQDLDDDYYRETERFVYLYAVGENLTYQWYFDGEPVSGATTSVFDLTRVTNTFSSVASRLCCSVSNGTISVDSKSARIHNGGNPATAVTIRQIGSLDTEHLAVGDVVNLQAVLTPAKSTSEVRWQSTNPSVATVNNGTVTIVGQGSSQIKAIANNKQDEIRVTADSYRIEFDPAGGVFADGETANRVIRAVQDSDVEFPSVFREDNTFLGWTLDGSTVVNSLKATDNLQLHAKWEKSTEREDAELAIKQDLAEKQYARIGTDALFEVVTNGAKVKKYQWYVMDRSGSGWTEVNTGVTNDGARTSLTVPASASNNGYTYKVIVTPFNGQPVESSPSVLLTGSTEAEPQDNMKLFFTSNPVDVNTYLDQTVVFSATVNVENAEFRWQYSVHGGEEWVTLSGETGSTLTLEHVQEDMNGRLFRCIATYDGETKYSGTATLTINTNAAKVKSVSITAWNNLITVDSSYPSGEEIRIDSIVEKEDGEGEDKELVYEWQETDDGGTTWWPAENYSYEDPSIFIRPIDFELPDETTYFTYRLVVNGVASEPVNITVTQFYTDMCQCGCGVPGCTCNPGECPNMPIEEMP